MDNNFGQYIEVVSLGLLGEPQGKKGNEWRYGTHGSLAVDVAKGTWYCHETEQGGGVLDLIMRETSRSTVKAAIRWLEEQGIKPEEEPAPKAKPKLVKAYDYIDENGELRYQVCRMEPKTFLQRKPDGSGWNWSVKGVTPLPYRLMDIISKPDATVLIVEGEKDADALAALGLVATCNSGGAGKWPDSICRYFKGRKVVLLPDNDKAGADHAELVAGKLYGVAANVRVATLDGLTDKQDVSDWLAIGHARGDIVEVCKRTELWEPPKAHIVDHEPVHAPALQSYDLDYFSPLPHANDKGKPKKHIANLQEICRRLGVTVRYNVIAKEEEILIPNESFSMDNQANASLAWLNSECSLYDFAPDKNAEFITYLADKNLYNPVARWIESKEWDGVSRLGQMFATVTASCESTDQNVKRLKEVLMRRWMISAIAAAYLPEGVSAGGVLVFQGAQYLGKTKWFKSLVPEHLRLVKDGMLLRPDDKDSVKQICSFWLVELGELDSTFRKSDIAALKAFITNNSDVLRRPYARKDSNYARRTVFFGSVNPREFLHDATGNRRYWTIACDSLDHSHNLDMQQVWAEVKTLFDSGENWHLSPSEMDLLNSSNEEFMALDPVEERVRSRLDWESPEVTWRWEQATQIAIDCGVDRPNAKDISTAASAVRKLNGDRAKRYKGKNVIFCPPAVTGF